MYYSGLPGYAPAVSYSAVPLTDVGGNLFVGFVTRPFLIVIGNYTWRRGGNIINSLFPVNEFRQCGAVNRPEEVNPFLLELFSELVLS